MDFQGTFTRALKGEQGQYEATFTTTDAAAVAWLKNLNRTEPYDISVTKHREKRSLDANAYFHVLVGKIANKLGLGLEEVKKSMVEEYGTVAFVARIPATADLNTIYKYCKLIGESKGTKDPCNDWYIFKPTHDHNKEEMAKLIDGTIREAQQLKIETRTPQQIAELMSLWGEEK